MRLSGTLFTKHWVVSPLEWAHKLLHPCNQISTYTPLPRVDNGNSATALSQRQFVFQFFETIAKSLSYICYTRYWETPPVIKVISGPLFTKRMDVLLPNLAKCRSREIGYYNDRITLKFDRHLSSAAAGVPVRFQSDWKRLNPNLAASSFHEIMW